MWNDSTVHFVEFFAPMERSVFLSGTDRRYIGHSCMSVLNYNVTVRFVFNVEVFYSEHDVTSACEVFHNL